jgi:hypothetical protein
MSDQPGIMGPASYPIRNPMDKKLDNGRMANPPRYLEFGGLDGPGKFYGNANTSNQAPDKMIATLESGGPTGVKGAKRTHEKDI